MCSTLILLNLADTVSRFLEVKRDGFFRSIVETVQNEISYIIKCSLEERAVFRLLINVLGTVLSMDFLRAVLYKSHLSLFISLYLNTFFLDPLFLSFDGL